MNTPSALVEYKGEQQREHDRRHDQIEQLLRHMLEFECCTPDARHIKIDASRDLQVAKAFHQAVRTDGEWSVLPVILSRWNSSYTLQTPQYCAVHKIGADASTTSLKLDASARIIQNKNRSWALQDASDCIGGRELRNRMSSITLKYFGYHPYNNPTHSERNIELPLAFWFLELFKTDIRNVIEVGEVTSFYRPPRHTVYDIAAEKTDTIRKDAADIDYTDKHLLSISTIEHIGTSDYGQTPDPKRLPLVLEKMLHSKNYLITFALGYNPQLEELVKDKPYLILERIAPTLWQQTENRNLTGYRYHKPWYAGNGVCVLTNMQDLQLKFAPRSLAEVLSRRDAPQWSWKRFLRALRQEIRDDRQYARQKTTAAY